MSAFDSELESPCRHCVFVDESKNTLECIECDRRNAVLDFMGNGIHTGRGDLYDECLVPEYKSKSLFASEMVEL